jgi:hypothetical protein
MRQMIQQRGDQPFIAKGLRPIGKLEIGGDDQRASLAGSAPIGK